MNKLFKSVQSAASKDNLIKQAITTQLSNSVKEIQYCGIEQNGLKTEDIAEASNSLCMVIEAIFLHGIKDTLTGRFKRAIADVDERPEPSFWAPLLVISHRQIIDQIFVITQERIKISVNSLQNFNHQEIVQLLSNLNNSPSIMVSEILMVSIEKLPTLFTYMVSQNARKNQYDLKEHISHLSQITTEVGQCRAWIRLVLNDCLLSSYLTTMRRDPGALKSFYRPTSYVRDPELLDVAQRLIEGIETFKTFTLPCNSSLLNTWQLPSLYLAGIWSSTLKTCPLAPCDDVALMVEDTRITDSSETCSLSSAISVASLGSGLRQMVALNEDEALRIILAKHKDTNERPDDEVSTEAEVEKSSDSDANNYNNLGNSLNRGTGWSFDETQREEEGAVVEEKITNEPKSMEASFNALIESYNMLSGGYIKTPDLREVWQKFEDRDIQEIVPFDNNANKTEVFTEVVTAGQPKTESQCLAAQIGTISKEKGLDTQNYECAGCKQPIGLFQKLNICAFTGNYFCDLCMSEELLPIPARIIHNWDFKHYKVSQRAFDYINEIKSHPVIDFKVLNPYIYGVVEEMTHLQILRNQLNYLRAYLYTCREPVIEQLQKQMWPREYMYEHVHQYSITDLLEAQNGVLAQLLQSVVNFGREHVLECWLCSQKGFICEICDKSKQLFPFDVENIYRCDQCNAVYHKGCLNSSKPCPKCKRKRERGDSSLLGATVE